jgi:hypothetical protein
MQPNDPFAAAEVGAPVVTKPIVQSIPFAGPSDPPLDDDGDPFASPEDVGGGGGLRGPKIHELHSRLIMFKPTKKMLDVPPADPKSNYPNTDVWEGDLTVFGPEPISVYLKASDDGKFPERTDVYETPFTFTGWWCYSGKGLHAKIDGLAATGKSMLLAVVKQCPRSAGYKAGKTWQDTERELMEYAQKNAEYLSTRRGPAPTEPLWSWGFIQATPEQMEIARAWLRGK